MVIDTQTFYLIVLAGNMVVNCFLAYLYHFRVKIEQKQTEIAEENAISKRCLRELRKNITLEKEDIMMMAQPELEEFLETLKHLGEED